MGLAAPGRPSMGRAPLEEESSQPDNDAESEGPATVAVTGLVTIQQPTPEGSPGIRLAALLAATEHPEVALSPDQRAECVQLLRQAGAAGATVVERGGARRLVGPLHTHQQPQTGEH